MMYCASLTKTRLRFEESKCKLTADHTAIWGDKLKTEDGIYINSNTILKRVLIFYNNICCVIAPIITKSLFYIEEFISHQYYALPFQQAGYKEKGQSIEVALATQSHCFVFPLAGVNFWGKKTISFPSRRTQTILSFRHWAWAGWVWSPFDCDRAGQPR